MNSLKIAKDLNVFLTSEYNEEGSSFRTSYFGNGTSFTKEFFKELERIITQENVEIYRKSDYLDDVEYAQNEKITMDSVTWKSFHGDSIKTYIKSNMWKYVTVMEHENNGESWLSELQKLCSIKCDEKLIITYGRCAKEECKKSVYQTKDDKGVNLLNHANEIVIQTLSKSEKKILSLISDGNEYADSLPNIVLMFGAENDELKRNNKVLKGLLYDIYRFDYKMKKFVRVPNEKN